MRIFFNEKKDKRTSKDSSAELCLVQRCIIFNLARMPRTNGYNIDLDKFIPVDFQWSSDFREGIRVE